MLTTRVLTMAHMTDAMAHHKQQVLPQTNERNRYLQRNVKLSFKAMPFQGTGASVPTAGSQALKHTFLALAGRCSALCRLQLKPKHPCFKKSGVTEQELGFHQTNRPKQGVLL